MIGIRAEEIDRSGDNITIICFNYDRCVERLFGACESYKRIRELPVSGPAKSSTVLTLSILMDGSGL